MKSSGNANVPVNTLPETINQFKGDVSGRPESRPTTVNPLPLQRQQQQIGGLHESSIRADVSGVKETSSFSHQQRGLSPWAVKHNRGQDRERFNRFQFQDPLPNDRYFRPSLSLPGPSTRNATDSRAEPRQKGMDSFPSSQPLRNDQASDVVKLVRHFNRPKTEILYFDGDPMDFWSFVRNFESRKSGW